jgi:hypothetical protein
VLGNPLQVAARFANVCAALSCRGLDGRSGIPDLAEVEHHLSQPRAHSHEQDGDGQGIALPLGT